MVLQYLAIQNHTRCTLEQTHSQLPAAAFLSCTSDGLILNYICSRIVHTSPGSFHYHTEIKQRLGPSYGFRLPSREEVISLGGVDKLFESLSAGLKDALCPE